MTVSSENGLSCSWMKELMWESSQEGLAVGGMSNEGYAVLVTYFGQ